MKKIGLLFGSFDPIHGGHLAIAEWALTDAAMDEVWIVLSPQNPMKNSDASPFEHRAAMINLAIEGKDRIKLCTVESTLCPPCYSINTIIALQEANPDCAFSILCGTDVAKQSGHWHRAEELHKMVRFIEYPRYENCFLKFHDISSTEIRQGSKLEYLHPAVRSYIEQHQIYNSAFERGKALYAAGNFSGAINAWSECAGTRFEAEAETLSQLASEILAYSYTEIYNP